LNRLALVDAQRRDRLGPAETLLQHAKRITVVDHHVDQDSDIPATDYVIDKVGSVSALICELLQESNVQITEVEATLFALGIHADTGSLRFDSTTPRDAKALAWCLEQGASQVAIAEHAQSSLSSEQQNALTQSLINVNSTVVHGVTLSTVLLSADGFINGLASVTQDALELSSSDIFITGMVYEATSGGSRRNKSKQQAGQLLSSRLLSKTSNSGNGAHFHDPPSAEDMAIVYLEAWKGGDAALKERKLRMAFDRSDKDRSGKLDIVELKSALASYGIIASSDDSVSDLMAFMDTNGDGGVDFEEFVQFAMEAEQRLQQQNNLKKKAVTMILVGRVKAGVSLKAVSLSKLFAKFGGGGHAKAASATVRLNDESDAAVIMQELVDELIQTSLQAQPTVGDFMTSPCLSLKPHMTETQVEALFTRYDVRALPVVNEKNDVIGLVTYKEVASAKVRRMNSHQCRSSYSIRDDTILKVTDIQCSLPF
jgi:nanoRNase/pAp phosphatase (c-di-AMP/oligoRNAs hydrolase)